MEPNHRKKKLAWIYQSGDTDVGYQFVPKPGAKPISVELNLSCTQATICLMFNTSKQLRVKDFLDSLGCEEKHLKFSLTPLLYTKERFLANKGPDGKGKKADLNDDGTPAPVTWKSLAHEDYIGTCPIKQPKRRQVYPALKPLPGAPGNDDVVDPRILEVMQDRELKMQLALVRVMKARNTLLINQLIAEATEQLIKYFIPEGKQMRKQIEVLMERQFMKRDDEDQRKIHYVA